MCESFGDVEHITQFEGVDEFGIEDARVVVYADIFVAFFEGANGIAGGLECVFGSENARAFFHGFAEIIADMGHALFAAVAKELGFNAFLFVLRHFGHQGRICKVNVGGVLCGYLACARAKDEAFAQ